MNRTNLKNAEALRAMTQSVERFVDCLGASYWGNAVRSSYMQALCIILAVPKEPQQTRPVRRTHH